MKKRRVGVKAGEKVIVHKLFAECAKLTTDAYTKGIFNKLAKGTFPQRISYDHGILRHTTPKKVSEIELCDDPVEDYSAILIFLREKEGIFSPTETVVDPHKEIKENTKEGWSKFTPKSKAVLLDNYLHKLREDYKLSRNMYNSLKIIMSVGLYNKWINKDTVVVNGGEITDITNLRYEEGKFSMRKQLAKESRKGGKKTTYTRTYTDND